MIVAGRAMDIPLVLCLGLDPFDYDTLAHGLQRTGCIRGLAKDDGRMKYLQGVSGRRVR